MKKLFVLAGILLAVGSCSKRETGLGERSELILSGQVAFGGSVVSSETPAAKPAGALDPLPATNLGVYVLTKSGDAQTDFNTTSWKNEAFTSDASGIISGGNVSLRTGTSYDIYAYAPRIAAVSDAHTVPVVHGQDVLWAKASGIVATAGGTKAQLEFRHCGAQVGFQLKASDGTTDLTGADLEVVGFYKTGMLDAGTGALTLSDPTQVLTDKSGDKTNILVDGQAMALSVKVTNVPGRPEPFTGSFSLTLKPGESWLFDVNVNMDGGGKITFVGEVVNWVDVEAGNLLPAE